MKTHPFIAALTLPNVSVTSPDASASELGSDTGTFRVTRVGVANSPLTVSYVVSGSAVNGADYNALSNFVVIPAGSSSININLIPRDDAAVEGPEFVSLTLVETAGYYASLSNTVVTIGDNEAGLQPFSLQFALPSSNLFRLTLTGPATRLYNIDVATELNSWTPWTTLVNPNGTAHILEPGSTNTNLFFRARLE